MDLHTTLRTRNTHGAVRIRTMQLEGQAGVESRVTAQTDGHPWQIAADRTTGIRMTSEFDTLWNKNHSLERYSTLEFHTCLSGASK